MTPWTAACQVSLSITNSRSLLELMLIETVMPSNHLILCRPLLLPPSVLPSIRVFSNQSVAHIRWSKYWSFSFSLSPSMNIQGWFPLGLSGWIFLQSIGLSRVFYNTTVQRHQFFNADLSSNPHMTSRKTLALTRWTFVGKEMSLLFNMLSRVVINIIWRSKHLLISWLQSPSAVI